MVCLLILCRSSKLSVAHILLEEVAIRSTTELLSRRPTNWRTIIPKKFLHCCKSSRVHNRFPNLGIWQRESEPPGNLTLKASGIWLQNSPRTGETDSWRAQHCAHQDPGERNSDPRGWARLACECLGVSSWGVGDSGQPQGQGHWLQQLWEPRCAGVSPLGGQHYCHYPYHYLAWGQTTGREHSPTH